jgi:hypothetical protein
MMTSASSPTNARRLAPRVRIRLITGRTVRAHSLHGERRPHVRTGVDEKLSARSPDRISGVLLHEQNRCPTVDGDLEQSRLTILIGRDRQPLPTWRPCGRSSHIELFGDPTRTSSVDVHHIQVRRSASLDQEREALTVWRYGGSGNGAGASFQRPSVPPFGAR